MRFLVVGQVVEVALKFFGRRQAAEDGALGGIEGIGVHRDQSSVVRAAYTERLKMGQPPLRPLHRDESLNKVKLAQFERLQTEAVIHSLEPGQTNCLRVRLDGTMLEGHHRVHVLRSRGVDVDALPRVIEQKQSD